MIFNTLREGSIQKFYDKEIEKKRLSKDTSDKIKTVAVLIDEDIENQISLKDISEKLNVNINLISVLVYQSDSKNEVIGGFNYFTEKDFGRRGSLKSNNLKSFVKKDYDVLINCTSQSNLYLNMLTLLSQAKFKIGFADIDDRLFDLIITDGTFDASIFNKEIHKYLTILKKI
ncbi:hypothetical protein V3A08_00105 [Tenacibaculum maritimum]|uniref:DUF6913 domain-containing protein n=2 Tax=Tenacibaculum maritimum TaxID=107401 RepID=UPI0012E435FD|nr:hypothetical protein [Tenacibaculum maritimum]MDB0602985.1 hypothetical protein [Tenacibaculum maritimum]MDB0611558.1 hypothetical protein [Tenacibaculum maritimum]CAA0224676.1 conserved hypothetical protein [Tenacibaculum maritimum]